MADNKLPVVAVHGVGSGKNKDRAGFSKELSTNVHAVERPVIRIGPYENVKNASEADPKDGILWQEALWESVNDLTPEALEAFAKKQFPLSPVAWFLTLIDIVSDVPLYLGANGGEIRRVVKEVILKHPNCVLVGHSLGSVISADILREEQQTDNFSKMPVSAFITIGSPLNLLKMRNPMDKPFPFVWDNFYYPKDPIAVNGDLIKSEFPGVRNHTLSAGETFAVSHTSYWSSTVLASAVYSMSCGGGGMESYEIV
ncbi:MAG TPA: hypothetical protein VI727_11345 [Candidatus Brocadiaceae bacterium]|nr:hypothetical protein [Candidatus Brocadiaceae bacterium]